MGYRVHPNQGWYIVMNGNERVPIIVATNEDGSLRWEFAENFPGEDE